MFRFAKMVGLFLWVLGLAGPTHAQTQTDIKQGDATVSALVMGEGEHAVILLHGSLNGPEVYFTQGPGGNMGTDLAKAGFRVISIAWAGSNEVPAAIRYAKETGAKKISLLGQSTGTAPVAAYAATAAEGELDTVILMSAVTKQEIPLTKTKKLFVYSSSDRRARFDAPVMAEKSAEPKQIFALDGMGHPIGALMSARPTLLQDVIAILKQ